MPSHDLKVQANMLALSKVIFQGMLDMQVWQQYWLHI